MPVLRCERFTCLPQKSRPGTPGREGAFVFLIRLQPREPHVPAPRPNTQQLAGLCILYRYLVDAIDDLRTVPTI